MNNYSLIADLIKQRVSFENAVQAYGLKVNRSGFVICPFHSEKTASLKVHKDYGYCFGCGWKGDLISFTQNLFGLSFLDALRKLNTDFNCGAILDRKPTLRERWEAEKRYDEILAEREQAEAERKAYITLYNALWDEFIRLDRNRNEYAPKSAEEEINPLYAEAVAKIDYQYYLINTLL